MGEIWVEEKHSSEMMKHLLCLNRRRSKNGERMRRGGQLLQNFHGGEHADSGCLKGHWRRLGKPELQRDSKFEARKTMK